MAYRWIFVLIGLLVLQTAIVGQTESEPLARLKVSPIDPEWLAAGWAPPADKADEFARERDLSKHYPGRILRWTNLLALKLDNGLFVWLVDLGAEPSTLDEAL